MFINYDTFLNLSSILPFMSKGFGKLQIKIIEYIETKSHFSSSQVINFLTSKKPTASDRSNIYKAIVRLRNDGVIIKSGQRSLLIYHPQKKPISYMLNKKNTKYKRWKQL